MLSWLRWWIAADALLASSEAAVRSGDGTLGSRIPVFRSRENILEPGWHEWESNYDVAEGGVNWVASGLSCLTTVL